MFWNKKGLCARTREQTENQEVQDGVKNRLKEILLGYLQTLINEEDIAKEERLQIPHIATLLVWMLNLERKGEL